MNIFLFSFNHNLIFWIEYGLLGVFLLITGGREFICWLTNTNKILEKTEDQLREIKEIKSQIDRHIEESKTQGKVLEGVGSDIKRLNAIVQKITNLNPAANSADNSSG